MTNVINKVIKNGTEYEIYAGGGASGAGDVFGPVSATNGHLAVFDGTSGKAIKDGGAVPTGTITGITMNGASKGTSGVVDLGTVITEHQDISGKVDKLSAGTLDKAYIVNTSGTQTSYNVSQGNSSGAIVRRSGTGIVVPDTPSANTHAVNKNYVDGIVGNIETLLAAL